MTVEHFYLISALVSAVSCGVTIVGWLATFVTQAYLIRKQQQMALDRDARDLLIPRKVNELEDFKNWLEFPLNVMSDIDPDSLAARMQVEWTRGLPRYGTLARQYDQRFSKGGSALEPMILEVNTALLAWLDALRTGSDPADALGLLREVVLVTLPKVRNRIETLKELVARQG